MEEIARRVPLSKIARPAWDLQQLASLGMKAEADETVWKRVWSEEETISFASTPMFLVQMCIRDRALAAGDLMRIAREKRGRQAAAFQQRARLCLAFGLRYALVADVYKRQPE